MKNGRSKTAKKIFALNNCGNIDVIQGTISAFEGTEGFDVLLANINKNVLLEEMNRYCKLLKQDGVLVLSGFYESDIDDLCKSAAQFGLKKRTATFKTIGPAFLFRLIDN